MGGFDHVVMKQVTKQVNLKNVGLYVLHRSYVISEPASYADIRWARHAICVTSPKNVCLRGYKRTNLFDSVYLDELAE